VSEPTCGVCGRVLTDEAMRNPPTWRLEPVPGANAVRPVLNKPIRMDPETGAVCWCRDEAE